jgi:hypothetical protein
VWVGIVREAGGNDEEVPVRISFLECNERMMQALEKRPIRIVVLNETIVLAGQVENKKGEDTEDGFVQIGGIFDH